MRGHPRPVSNLFAPVKFAVTLGSHTGGFCPAFQAIAPSTKNSGRVCTMATIASASPWLMENWEASAAQAIIIAAATTEPNVNKANTTVREENEVDEASSKSTTATPMMDIPMSVA